MRKFKEKECVEKSMELEHLSKRSRGLLPLWVGYKLAFYFCKIIKNLKAKK